jgi:hypothetical protein
MFTNADKYSILTLNIISDFNALKLLYNGALFSEYMRIVPDWENPYFYFMDNADMFKREWISWNYDSEGINTKWEKIEKYVPIAEDLLSDINEIRQYNTNRKTDSIYGFFEPGSYLNKSSRWWDFWDPSYSGFTGEKNFSNNKNLSKSNFAKRQLFVEEPHILKPIRTTQKLWQAQFDMMDLPISYLKKILTEIKWPLSLNRFKYAEAKKNKIKWDIWKEKICCERKVPSTFFAIITDATKIFGPTGGICGNSGPLVNGSSNLTGTTAGIPCYDYFDNASIWAYNWSEVELWPTSEVEAIKGTTLMYFYFFDKDQRSNDITLQYSATNPNTNSKFPFVFVVPPGGLSGTITTGLIKDSRMTPNEIKWQKDTRAYNIRELLNSNFYGKTSGETYAATMLGTAVSAFGKLSEINRADVTNYPEHYSMLPVGKFLLAKERQEPINFFSPYIKFGEQKGNPDDVGNTGDFYFHGALVQMYSIPASTISGMTLMGLQSTVKIQEENYNIKTNTITKTTKSKKERVKYFKNDYLFVFDAPNNHAGICRCNL